MTRVASGRGYGREFQPARGATLFAVLVCLLVIMLYSSAVLRSLMLQRHSQRLHAKKLQCYYLAESALQRAKTQIRLNSNPPYTNESWRVSLDDRGVAQTGVAEVRVETVDDNSQRVRIRIEARWPDESPDRVLHVKEVTLDLPSPGAST